MAIDTHCVYLPHHTLPLYVKITDPKFNSYDLFKTYEMRYDDADESGFQEGHEAMLVAKSECEWSEIPPLLIAFAGHSRDAEEAVRNTFPADENPEGDRDMVILMFLRLDKAKEHVMGETEPINTHFEKEDVQS